MFFFFFFYFDIYRIYVNKLKKKKYIKVQKQLPSNRPISARKTVDWRDFWPIAEFGKLCLYQPNFSVGRLFWWVEESSLKSFIAFKTLELKSDFTVWVVSLRKRYRSGNAKLTLFVFSRKDICAIRSVKLHCWRLLFCGNVFLRNRPAHQFSPT